MKLYEILFSPTGGTKKAADILEESLAALGGLSDMERETVDLTDWDADFSAVSPSPEDIALLAVPSYGGLVPKPALERLEKIRGNGARAVLVCVYGNRAFEDTLTELFDAAKRAGFQTAAAVAAIAEHSIARAYACAAGRPDSQDEAQLKEYAGRIWEKLTGEECSAPSIPGNRPYKKRGVMEMIPMPADGCTSCGLCAEKCPVQAIDRANPAQVDREKCICCMRCIAVCPQAVRALPQAAVDRVSSMLSSVSPSRRECELFL